MTQLPDLAQSFAKIRLAEMISWNKDNSLFAQTCRDAVNSDYHGVIQMIQDQLKDNPRLTTSLMGADLILLLDDLHGSALTSYQRWQLSKYGNILAERKDGGEWNGPVPDYRADEREAREQNFEL